MLSCPQKAKVKEKLRVRHHIHYIKKYSFFITCDVLALMAVIILRVNHQCHIQ